MPGLWPCDWGDPQPIWGRINKEVNPLLSAQMVRYPAVPPIQRAVVKPMVSKNEFDPGGMRTEAALDQVNKYCSIPDDEKCDGNYDLPEFLKDPKFGIANDDEVVVSSGGYVSDETRAFLDLLENVEKDLVKQIKFMKESGCGVGTDGAPKATIINFLESFCRVGDIVRNKFDNMFPASNDEKVNILKGVIKDREDLTNRWLHKYKGVDCADEEMIGDGQEMLDIFFSLHGSFSMILKLFREIIENRCPDDIAEIVQQNSNVKDYKFIDTSSTKLLLIKIPEKLFLKSGYKSIEKLMAELEKKGVVVAAVPESLNLYEIKDEDLKKLDLSKVSKARKST